MPNYHQKEERILHKTEKTDGLIKELFLHLWKKITSTLINRVSRLSPDQGKYKSNFVVRDKSNLDT